MNARDFLRYLRPADGIFSARPFLASNENQEESNIAYSVNY